ncbi:MAG: T9SS type A sorting domain-containing protein [Bacteroidetes bacterium]|nr:T9SS type A sorting domain-containing protein [Bacteroidota bacterium]
MKHCALLLLLVCSFMVRAQFQTDEIAVAEAKHHAYIHKGLRSVAIDNSNVIYTRLELKVDPAIKYLNGAVTTHFIPRGDISFLEFDLTDSLLVDSIVYHNTPLPYTRPGNDLLHINLPVSIPDGALDSIAIYYQGIPVGGEGFGSFMQATHGPDSIPIIWTLSEPYGAKDWWPCKSNLNDKIDSIDVWVTCPQQYRAASNGLLIAEYIQGLDKVYKWKHRYPVATYLVAFAVTDYAVFSVHVPLHADTLEVLNYVFPEQLSYAQSEVPNIIRQMQVYDSLFGPYPFMKEKYGHAQFGWGGGMEHQTMSFMYNFGYELMAHELAHQWFGDKVTCASWQDIWLNEGFATYLTALCYQYIQPQYFTVFKQQRIGSAVSEPGGSVFCYDTSNVGRIFNGRLTYNKAGMVLNTLRWVIGDDAFFGGLRSYLSDVMHEYAFATTPQLKSHLEAASGKDLTHFFDAWIYKEGYPSYQIAWSQNFEGKVKLSLNQTQSHPSVSYFILPVPIKFIGTGIDTTIVFNNTANGDEYTFQLPWLVDSLVLDPDVWLICANNTIIKQSAYNFHMLLYPNPAQHYIDVRIESETEKEVDVMVYNTAGALLYSQRQHVNAGGATVTLNTNSYAPGVYTVKVKADSDKKPLIDKFIKAAN